MSIKPIYEKVESTVCVNMHEIEYEYYQKLFKRFKDIAKLRRSNRKIRLDCPICKNWHYLRMGIESGYSYFCGCGFKLF